MKDKYNIHDFQVEDLQNNIDATKISLIFLQNNLAETNDQITVSNEELTDLNASLPGIEDKINEVTSDVNKNAEDINLLQERLDTVNESLIEIEADIDTLEDRLTATPAPLITQLFPIQCFSWLNGTN